MEVGWYLRFYRHNAFSALVQTKVVSGVMANFPPDGGWDVENEKRGEHTLMRFTRRKKI